MAKKKEVREQITGSALYPSFFTTIPIAELRTNLADLDSKHTDQGYRNITLEEIDDWDGDFSAFALYGTRDEAAVEQSRRLMKAKKEREAKKLAKSQREEKERKEYERLHKKYGK